MHSGSFELAVYLAQILVEKLDYNDMKELAIVAVAEELVHRHSKETIEKLLLKHSNQLGG